MLIPSLSVPLQAENEPLPTLLDRREIILRGKEWNRILHSASGGDRLCFCCFLRFWTLARIQRPLKRFCRSLPGKISIPKLPTLYFSFSPVSEFATKRSELPSSGRSEVEDSGHERVRKQRKQKSKKFPHAGVEPSLCKQESYQRPRPLLRYLPQA